VTTVLERRLAEITAALDEIAPRPPHHEGPAWLPWCTTAELLKLDLILRRLENERDAEPTDVEQWEAAAIECASIARMLAAPPEVRADPAARDAHVRALEEPAKTEWERIRVGPTMQYVPIGPWP